MTMPYPFTIDSYVEYTDKDSYEIRCEGMNGFYAIHGQWYQALYLRGRFRQPLDICLN
jgi:hypothetical protein